MAGTVSGLRDRKRIFVVFCALWAVSLCCLVTLCFLCGVYCKSGLLAGIAQVSQPDSLVAFSQTRKSHRVPTLRLNKWRPMRVLSCGGSGVVGFAALTVLCLLFGLVMAGLHQLPFEKPLYELEDRLLKLESQQAPTPAEKEIMRRMRVELTQMTRERYANLDPWQTVQVSRHPDRPQTPDYLELVFDEFVELHGDKAFGDDRAMVTGFARLAGRKVMFVGHQKGRNLKERNECCYGCAHPEGYRKAMQKMEMASRFGLPIICLIDTPGAYPGIGAEERGQAYNIAVNLRDMSTLEVPIICVVIGEGGSGGALGIGMGDHVAVLEFAYYSVISPEGCAGILWKSSKHADKAAKALRFTSKDLTQLGVVDEVIPEPLGGAHRDHFKMATTLKARLVESLQNLDSLAIPDLLERRYQRYRRIGVFHEDGSATSV